MKDVPKLSVIIVEETDKSIRSTGIYLDYSIKSMQTSNYIKYAYNAKSN